MMDDNEKMLWMYEQVYGPQDPSSTCKAVVHEDEDGYLEIHMMKDGHVCWSMSKADLIFEYLTKGL